MTVVAEQTKARLGDYLAFARRSVAAAADAIRPDFGQRRIVRHKGEHDVQLLADIRAHNVLVDNLVRLCPDHHVVSEEGLHRVWVDKKPLWAIDPLDGTNNFGYGVAHCAIVVSLFVEDEVALAVVRDPLIDREFFATADQPYERKPSYSQELGGATLSLVAGYADRARARAQAIEPKLSSQCKRVLNLWAPGLDLALVADGLLDGMICFEADLLDVCAGAFLVRSAGGFLLDLQGNELTLRRSMHSEPITFVAAMDKKMAEQLQEFVSAQGV